MSKKTEYASCFNDDDFVESSGEMHELTVTITLCEYRNLIREQARAELEIERKDEEIAALTEKCDSLTKALAACKLPDWINAIGKALSGMQEDEEDDAAEEDDTERTDEQ